MNKPQPITTVGEAGNLLERMAADATPAKKYNKTPLASSDKVDPEGLQWVQALTKIYQSQMAAAEALGISDTAFSDLLRGGPVRKSISLACQKLLDDATTPKAVTHPAQQTVAVVVVPKDKGDMLAMAVKGIGGTFSPLSFDGEGVKV